MGLVQGLTEFLPISSSAHLRILGDILPSAKDPGAAFTAVIQIGTEAAVLLYFRRDIARILVAWWAGLTGRIVPRVGGWLGFARRDGSALVPTAPSGNHDERMGWLIIIGTLPVAVLGLFFTHAIETYLRDLRITAAMLIIFGLVLGWADAFAARRERRGGVARKEISDLSVKDGLLYGLAQALALIPGVSRSGGTITAGLVMGYSRAAAARYSFLLAVPAVLASGFYELMRAVAGGTEAAANFPGWGATLVAAIVAFVVGYFVIIAFLRIVSTFSYRPFVLYRLGLGALVIILLAFRVVQA